MHGLFKDIPVLASNINYYDSWLIVAYTHWQEHNDIIQHSIIIITNVMRTVQKLSVTNGNLHVQELNLLATIISSSSMKASTYIKH